MKIIPVIDIRNHRAAHALRGRRERYRPLKSALCPTDDAAAVAAAYLAYHRFSDLYLADLDAIEGAGENSGIAELLLRRHPDIALWIDAGRHAYPRELHAMFPGRARIVLGTESGLSAAACRALRRRFDCVLSLDYRGDVLRRGDGAGRPPPDPPESLLSDEIILMSLHRVGARNGPDRRLLRRWRALTKDSGRKLYAAGGVRGKDDLLRLHRDHAAGALVASCLHDKTLKPAEIAELEAMPPPGKQA